MVQKVVDSYTAAVIDEPVRGGFPEPSFFSLPGIEQARALQRGLVPRTPLSHLTGILPTQVGPGSATVTMPASPWLVDHYRGTVQLSVLIDTALWFATLTGAPSGSDVTTATLTTSYVRRATLDRGSFVARSRVVHTGRTYTLAEVVVEDSAGRSIAQSMASMLVRPIDPPPPPLSGPLRPVPAPAYPTPDPYLRPSPRWEFEHDPLVPDRDVLRRIVAGDLATFPALQLFGGRIVDVDEGLASVAFATSEWHCGPDRVVLPGVLAYQALNALNATASSLAPPGYFTAVLSVNFTFLRPVIPDGRELLARGSVVHQAGDLVVSSAEITDANGKRVALGQESGVFRQRASTARTGEDRSLLTVLFTDIVASTEQAERLGDASWRNRLDEHHTVIRRELELFKGREVKTTGDGFLATFDSPGRAVQCARAIRDVVHRLGLEVRVGLHTGECEVTGADVAGIAVHIASRVQGLAGSGEILVSGTVRDLVTGSGLRFTDRGRHHLKGIEGDWLLFAVDG